ncbi:MAG: hypothetical protein ACLQPD_07410 [Desulfomonilaceae bacterium]
MYDIHLKAESIRTEGLQEIELLLDSLIIAGRDPMTDFTYITICERKALTTVIYYIFNRLSSDRIILGIIDTSKLDFVPGGCIQVARDVEITEDLAEDIWVVLRSIYENYAFEHPEFHQVCTDLIRRVAIRKMNESITGHC